MEKRLSRKMIKSVYCYNWLATISYENNNIKPFCEKYVSIKVLMFQYVIHIFIQSNVDSHKEKLVVKQLL